MDVRRRVLWVRLSGQDPPFLLESGRPGGGIASWQRTRCVWLRFVPAGSTRGYTNRPTYNWFSVNASTEAPALARQRPSVLTGLVRHCSWEPNLHNVQWSVSDFRANDDRILAACLPFLCMKTSMYLVLLLSSIFVPTWYDDLPRTFRNLGHVCCN